MNITINREELLSAAQDADKVTPRHSPMEILGCTYLLAEDDTVTVAAGNLEIALERRIPAEIRQRGALVLKSDLLAQLLMIHRNPPFPVSFSACCRQTLLSFRRWKPVCPAHLRSRAGSN